jgi:geranylgeranyl diphosphate synthase type I
MLWLKTGILYEFAGLAGAMIGKDTADIKDSGVQAVKSFTGKCGIAFQLQDDILGILGDEKVLGKPVGSDIREGKKTTIVLEALKNANEEQREAILKSLGNPDCSEDDIKLVKTLFVDLNGIEHTRNLALNYIKEALPHLEKIKDSYYRMLLYEWADYMVNRDF